MNVESGNSASDGDVEATIFYAGDSKGHLVNDVHNPEQSNLVFYPHQIMVRDACDRREQLELDSVGFCFARHPSQFTTRPEMAEDNRTRHGRSDLNAAYLAEMAGYLKHVTGAREVLPMAIGLVYRTSVRAARPSWAGPASFVHLVGQWI